MRRILILTSLFSFVLSVPAQTSGFVRGADISWCTEMEADGRVFRNAEGTETELFALMKQIGMTAIRLRVWVNPTKYGYGAWCDKADVLAKAKRAYSAGLDLMTRMKQIPQCAGVFYWEPEVDGVWKPAYYQQLGWGAYGMGAFTTDGRPTAALDAFGDDTSGIRQTRFSNVPKPQVIYSLNGTRQDTMQRGINIVDGKVYLVK